MIISNNTPPIKKSEIEYYAMLSKTGVHHYTGSEPRLQAFHAQSKVPLCPCKLACIVLQKIEAPVIMPPAQCFVAMWASSVCDSIFPRCAFPADNVELGTACGKLHRVSVLAITDAGEKLQHSLFCAFSVWLWSDWNEVCGIERPSFLSEAVWHKLSCLYVVQHLPGSANMHACLHDRMKKLMLNCYPRPSARSNHCCYAGDSDIIKAQPTE